MMHVSIDTMGRATRSLRRVIVEGRPLNAEGLRRSQC